MSSVFLFRTDYSVLALDPYQLIYIRNRDTVDLWASPG